MGLAERNSSVQSELLTIKVILYLDGVSLDAAGLMRKLLEKFDVIPKSDRGPDRGRHLASDSCAKQKITLTVSKYQKIIWKLLE